MSLFVYLQSDPAKKKEELKKFGIYFDDDYDYLQHLKDSKEVSNIEWDVCERIYASDIKPKAETSNKSENKVLTYHLPKSK
jgi:protein LTV1